MSGDAGQRNPGMLEKNLRGDSACSSKDWNADRNGDIKSRAKESLVRNGDPVWVQIEAIHVFLCEKCCLHFVCVLDFIRG